MTERELLKLAKRNKFNSMKEKYTFEEWEELTVSMPLIDTTGIAYCALHKEQSKLERMNKKKKSYDLDRLITSIDQVMSSIQDFAKEYKNFI